MIDPELVFFDTFAHFSCMKKYSKSFRLYRIKRLYLLRGLTSNLVRKGYNV